MKRLVLLVSGAAGLVGLAWPRRRRFTLFLLYSAGLCLMLPGAVQASVLYSFTGSYPPYSVAISFNTSLTGAALDNLVSANITPTVSNFSETNNIGVSIGGGSLSVILSTDALGNITAFTITDTQGQIVTETSDSANNVLTFAAPPTDLAGRPVQLNSTSSTELFARYETIPNDFFCKYFLSTGLLEQDHDNGQCPPVANPTIENLSASGSGTFTSTPPNPGATGVPEPATISLVGVGLVATHLALKRRRHRT